jgi:hypothetical protein
MDNRKLTRIQFKSNVELINNDVSVKGVIHNLSIGGMFVETAGKLDIDADVDVKISLGEKNDLPLKLKGKIKRRDNNGMAVEFQDEMGLTQNLSGLFVRTFA